MRHESFNNGRSGLSYVLSTFIALFSVAMVSVAQTSAFAGGPTQLEKELDTTSAAIAKFIADEYQGAACKVDSFQSNGPSLGIAQSLSTSLQKHGIRIAEFGDPFKISISGVVKPFPNLANIEELIIEIELKDENLDVVKKFDGPYSIPNAGPIEAKQGKITAHAKDEAAVSVLAGIPVDFSETKSPRGKPAYFTERKNLLKDSHEYPTQQTHGNEVTHKKADYGISIMLGSKELTPEDRGGPVPRCSIPRGSEFTVRLYNHTQAEAAVALQLDGLDSFVFSEEKQSGTPVAHWLVPPNSHRDIKGWYVNSSRVDGFTVTGFEQSALYQLRAEAGANAGFISASFRAAWPEGDKAPLFLGEGYGSGDDPFIGRGDPKHVETKIVKRHFSDVRQTIVLTYREQK